MSKLIQKIFYSYTKEGQLNRLLYNVLCNVEECYFETTCAVKTNVADDLSLCGILDFWMGMERLTKNHTKIRNQYQPLSCWS